MPGSNQSLPRGNSAKLAVRERQRRALEMRKAGATYQAIADQLGYASPGSARKSVLTAFDNIPKDVAADVRILQVERLHHMLMRVWQDVQTGEYRAMDIALRIMDQLNKIQGVEAPQQVEAKIQHEGAVIIIDGTTRDYIQGLRQMASGVIDVPASEPEEKALPPAQTPANNQYNWNVQNGEVDIAEE